MNEQDLIIVDEIMNYECENWDYLEPLILSEINR